MSERWLVAAGDPAYVVVPGLVKPINCGSKERERLVAAAPDLLEALKTLVEEIVLVTESATGGLGTVEKARAAISKATGEHP